MMTGIIMGAVIQFECSHALAGEDGSSCGVTGALAGKASANHLLIVDQHKSSNVRLETALSKLADRIFLFSQGGSMRKTV